MEKSIYVVKKVSKENKVYVQMYADLGYGNLPLSFDVATIAEFTNLSFDKIHTLELDKPLLVATFTRSK